MKDNIEHQESIGYDVDHRHQSSKLLAKKSFYFAIITLIGLLIIALTAHSYQRYNQAPKISPALQPLLPIHGGQIHYSRIPRQYWEHRILMIKAIGLNTLSVYVMWNYHQIFQEKFDFVSGDRDLVHFLTLAKRHEMKVLLRPGPYVCAEWDFGGLPARLLGIKGMRVRQANRPYETEVKTYFTALAEIVIPFLYKNKGPIIMIQIQNQLGYYTTSPEHMGNLISMWKELGVDSQFYYEESFSNWEKHYWPDVHIGISGGTYYNRHYHSIQISRKRTNKSILMGGQVYSGWFTNWGELQPTNEVNLFIQKFRSRIMYNISACAYMAIGGTNFGLTAGSNGYEPDKYSNRFRPHTTSYDYSALITENGRTTPNYFATRAIFQQYYQQPLTMEIPQPIPSISIPSFLPSISAHLFANLPLPTIVNSQLTYFESNLLKMYNQGMAIYETALQSQGKHMFNVTVHDFAILYINNKFVRQVRRGGTEDWKIIELACPSATCKLTVLVEAMGHVNFGFDMNEDHKGLISFKAVNHTQSTFKWNITKVQINSNIFEWRNKTVEQPFPVALKGSFQINQAGDTFLDMSKYNKGYIWVNNHLLGRYWRIGPQQRLYCPGVWLKKGVNKVHILELLHEKQESIAGYEENLKVI